MLDKFEHMLLEMCVANKHIAKSGSGWDLRLPDLDIFLNSWCEENNIKHATLGWAVASTKWKQGSGDIRIRKNGLVIVRSPNLEYLVAPAEFITKALVLGFVP